MKLRTAKKIMKQSSEDGNGKFTYTGGQLHRALQRYERCKSGKAASDFLKAAMFMSCGKPWIAFSLLMREEW